MKRLGINQTLTLEEAANDLVVKYTKNKMLSLVLAAAHKKGLAVNPTNARWEEFDEVMPTEDGLIMLRILSLTVDVQ